MQPSKSALETPSIERIRRDPDSQGPMTDAELLLSWSSRGSLSMPVSAGLIRHVTLSLADAVQEAALRKFRKDLRGLPQETQGGQYRQLVQAMLDQGNGSCALADFRNARLVEESLVHDDVIHHRLLAWCVMPNHVHALVERRPHRSVPSIVQSWKRRASRWTQTSLPTPSPTGQSLTWQRGYLELSIHNDDELLAVREQIDLSPVRAGLVTRAKDWPWCSARLPRTPYTV